MTSISRDDLFSVDPNEFVATRDRLVRELRAEGDKDGSREVKLLRRPSVPTWALNQVARTKPALIRRVLDTAASARQVQADVMNGADASALRRALADARHATEEMIAAVTAIIEQSGRSSTSYERELADTLNVIVSNGDVAEQLQTGRLVNVQPPDGPGVDLFAGLPEPKQPRTNRTRSSGTRATADERLEVQKHALEEARQRLREAEQAHREAVRVRDHAARALDNAQRAVEEAERHRKAAERAVERHMSRR